MFALCSIDLYDSFYDSIIWMIMRNLKSNLKDYLTGYSKRDGIDERRKHHAVLLNESLDRCHTLREINDVIHKTINIVDLLRNYTFLIFATHLDDADGFLAWLKSQRQYTFDLYYSHQKSLAIINNTASRLPSALLLQQLFQDNNFLYTSKAASVCAFICEDDYLDLIVKLEKLPAIPTVGYPSNGSFEAIDYSDNDEAAEMQGLLRNLVAAYSNKTLESYGISRKNFNDLNSLLQNSLSCVNDLKANALELKDRNGYVSFADMI